MRKPLLLLGWSNRASSPSCARSHRAAQSRWPKPRDGVVLPGAVGQGMPSDALGGNGDSICLRLSGRAPGVSAPPVAVSDILQNTL